MLAQVDGIVEMRTRLLSDLAGVPSPLLTRTPSGGGWSILEVIEHLVLAEESVLANMDRPELLRARRTSWRSRLGYSAIVAILSSPFRVSVPSAAMKPQGKRSFDELRAAWAASHEALRRHVIAVHEGRVSGAVFAHPVSGPLTTRQAVRMLRVHLKRHERQIRGILRSLEAEGAS